MSNKAIKFAETGFDQQSYAPANSFNWIGVEPFKGGIASMLFSYPF